MKKNEILLLSETWILSLLLLFILYYFKSPISVYDYVRDNDHELQYVPDHYNHYNHSDPDPIL